MTGLEGHSDPFTELMLFLKESGKLDETSAKIYVFGLKKGIMTSGDIVDENIVSRQTTAADRLRRLADRGYLECTLTEPKMRGKGHARKYRAIPPEVTLRDFLRKYLGIRDCVEKIREHRELLSEVSSLENEVWLLKPQRAAVNRMAEIIRSAKESIKIFSHDCTWFHHSAIKSSLTKASSNGVPIKVFATEADERTTKGLTRIGVSLSKISASYLPFCLIDDSLLLFPCTGGVLSREYFLILTRQKYLVNNFMKTFDSFLNWSEEQGRGKDV